MYDFAIVGAGSAGSVLAERLSASGQHQVILIEAGGTTDKLFVEMPMGLPFVLKNPTLAAAYQATTPAGDSEIWMRGRGLGGTSAINGMVYTRGQREDFADWEEAGATGWGWNAMCHAFEAIERGDPEGLTSGLNVSSPATLSRLSEKLLSAGRAMGMPVGGSPNGAQQFGVRVFDRTIDRGRRMSAAKAFLTPAQGRANLTVRTNTTVERVRFEGRRAVGLTVRDKSRRAQCIDARTIILCGGTIQSPMILQHSGIGDPTHLGALGITPIVAAHEVGRNLREHRIFTLQYLLRDHTLTNVPHLQGVRMLWNGLRYLARQSGVMANLAYEAAAFVKTDPTLARPDAELVFLPYALDMAQSEVFEGKMKFSARPGIQVVGCPLRPTSTGTINITVSDPAAPPKIEPNYLSTSEDRVTAIATMRYIRKFMNHPAMADVVIEEDFPGPAVSDDDAAILDFVAQQGKCGLHAVGTCRMGNDTRSVVDTALRVRGVDNLRVADCSVMPTMISGHTNAPAMALAWRAAEIILQESS